MKISSMMAGLFLALVCSASAQTIYWNNTFSSETVNTAWDTPTLHWYTGASPVSVGAYSLSGGMTLPTYVNVGAGAANRATAVLAPAFGTGTEHTGFSTNAVGLFTHPNPYGGGINGDMGKVTTDHSAGVNDPLTGTTTGKYVFSFDLSVATAAQSFDTSAWTIKPGMTLQSNYWDSTHTITGNKSLFSVTESSGNLILTSASGSPGGATTDTTLLAGFSALTPYTVAATLDMDARTFTLTLNGVQVGGTYNQLVGVTSGLGIGQYEAVGGRPNTTAGEGFNYFYDNISLQSAIPEPATWMMVLGGMGVLTLLRRRRTV